MKVLYDNIIYNLQDVGGISYYWYCLTKGMLEEEVDLKLLEYNDNNNFFRKKLSLLDDKKIDHRSKNILLERFKSVSLSSNEKFDIFHSSYYRVLKKQKNIKQIITLHDFIELQNKSRWRFLHRRQLYQAISQADGIICISEKTKKELFEYYPNLQNKYIEVIHHGVSACYKVLNQTEISQYTTFNFEKKNLVLYVGDRRARYKRFKELVLSLVGTPYNLLIAGGGKLSMKMIHFLNDHLPNRYIVKTFISSEDLNYFYNLSICLIYPSLNEGFGIPLLEAAKAGCPHVIYKNRIPNLLKREWGIELETLNTENLTEAIESCRNIKKSMRQDVSADDFKSWNDVVQDTLNFYSKVLSNV